MIPVGEHIVLLGQVRTTGIDEIDAWKIVLSRNLLCAKVFLHGDRKVGAALHRGVVGDDHAFAPGHPSDTRQDAARRDRILIHLPAGELGELEEGRPFVQECVDPVARQKLAAPEVTVARLLAAALLDLRNLLAQVRDGILHGRGVPREQVRTGIDARFENSHDERLRVAALAQSRAVLKAR
jgi:hypothetical protein